MVDPAMRNIMSCAGVLSAGLLLAGCGGGSDGGKPLELAILHINDHHANLDPATASLRLVTAPGAARSSVNVSLGGFARVRSAMEALAAQHLNVLKLHAGDALTGTLYYTLEEGRADATLMNSVCFDAMAVGNHEFDAGDAGLRKFADFLAADAA